MQHHVHAARPAPHIRPAHHHNHIPMHPGLNMAAALPQDQQHMGALGAAPPPPPAAMGVPPSQPPQQSQREHHHARLSHHHHHAQQTNAAAAAAAAAAATTYHHNTNQMQKIRQQHQHLSSSNGHAKCSQPPQPYNHIATNAAAAAAVAAAAALNYNQLPHHMPPHLGSYAAQPPQAVLGGKATHYYMKPSKYNNNNSHYNANNVSNANATSNNNNNNNNNYAPKTILQNAYRNAKVNGQVISPEATTIASATSVQTTTTAATAAAAELSNNIIITPDANANAAASDELIIESPTHLEVDGSEVVVATQPDDSCSTEHMDASNHLTLPNEDGSVGRSSKDKTPMCLVNELARYNKITHQYRLTGERGPAHCKTFTVTLKLGEEEYSADGFKIKKAQHLAASKAIEETKYKHPPPKVRRSEDTSNSRTHITPTVELNALAMKLGQRTYYLLDPTQVPPTEALVAPEFGAPLLPTPAAGMPPPPPPPPHLSYGMRRNASYVLSTAPMAPHVALQQQRGIFGHQRAYAPKYPTRFALPPQLGAHMLHGPHGPFAPLPVTPSKITLFVGKQKFVGIGRTLQQAKHDAAARALQVLKTQANNSADEALDDSMDEGDKKSPISQVHEIGIKRNMTVHFKVLREEGPAHMKNFITACIVGTIVTEGEGNGKKISKKRAAEKMLAELHKLPPLTPTKQTPMKRIKVKTPGKNAAATGPAAAAGTPGGKSERRKRANVSTKEKSAELDDAENPITKLIQLQQNRKEKEPVFELIGKNGNETSRRREFVIEVSANGNTARGNGNSKKLAKRNAAQALLEMLEAQDLCMESVQVSEHTTTATATTTTTAGQSTLHRGTSIEPLGLDVPMVSTPAGPVPGILILRQNKKPSKKKEMVVKANLDTNHCTKEEKDAKSDISNTVQSKDSESSTESHATEPSNESALNTSTGSNTSGVSSNSSTATAASSGGNSGGTGSNNSGGGSSSSGGGGVHMKEQLLYLGKLLDFEVAFSDYPKGNHNEFLTIVTLSTDPPQICHGVGKSSDESQNEAARSALKILSELGLNNAKK